MVICITVSYIFVLTKTNSNTLKTRKMTTLNNNLTNIQIKNIYNFCIGGEDTGYERESAVVSFLNNNSLTVEDVYEELDKNGFDY